MLYLTKIPDKIAAHITQTLLFINKQPFKLNHILLKLFLSYPLHLLTSILLKAGLAKTL